MIRILASAAYAERDSSLLELIELVLLMISHCQWQQYQMVNGTQTGWQQSISSQQNAATDRQGGLQHSS